MGTAFTEINDGDMQDASQVNQFVGPINWIEHGGHEWGGTSTGTATAYAVSVVPATPTLYPGQVVRFVPHISSAGGASSLSINRAAASPLIYRGAILSAGNLLAGVVYTCVFDGSQWHLQ